MPLRSKHSVWKSHLHGIREINSGVHLFRCNFPLQYLSVAIKHSVENNEPCFVYERTLPGLPPLPTGTEFIVKKQVPAFDKAQGQRSVFNFCTISVGWKALNGGQKGETRLHLCSSVTVFSADWPAVFLSCQNTRQKLNFLREVTF